MNEKGTTRLLIALGITVLFVIVQLIGGWIARSLALLADAAHMTTDLVGYGIALFAIWLAKKPPSKRMTYGYYRAEILGATLSCLLLWAICGFLVFEAVRRLMNPHQVKGGIVFIVASITLIFNLITMSLLRKGKDLNIKAVYLHVLSDLIGNVGVLLAGGLIWLTGWDIVDPIITILFTCLIVMTTWRTLGRAVGILMEATPKDINIEEVQKSLESLEGVEDVHDLHIWTIASGRIALSAHLKAKPGQLAAAQEILKERYSIEHSTIQIE